MDSDTIKEDLTIRRPKNNKTKNTGALQYLLYLTKTIGNKTESIKQFEGILFKYYKFV